MKKLLLLISAIIFANIAIAQTPCATIQEVRALPNGTEVHYIGTATTTFQTASGVLIQDATGYLYLKNIALAANGVAKIKTKMNISNIVGTFKTATESEMTMIQLYTDEAKAITKKEENIEFNITDITLEQLQANPMDYECRPIRLTNVATFESNGAFYLGTPDQKTPIQDNWDITIPTRGTFEGYYTPNGFAIPSQKHITATAYKTILSFKEAFYEEDPQIAYGLVDPVIVSYVQTNADNSLNIYAQQSIPSFGGMYDTYGILLKIEAYSGTISIGDEITGIKGLFSNFAVDKNDKVKHGTTMTITADNAQNITIKSRNNELIGNKIDDIEYIIGSNVRSYESILCITPKGTITKSGDKYTLVAGNKSIILEGIDLSKYEGQKLAITGIVDPGNINPGETSIIIRQESDIIPTNYTFNSIAEMIKAGEPLATGTTYTLTSKALVTHIDSRAGVDVTIYEIFVQDNTAGLYIETYFDPLIAAGDSISGITGSYHGYLHQHEGTTFTISSSNNLDKIQAEEVTMETLFANPEKYESQVVKLMGVGHSSRQVENYGQTTTQKYLYQDSYEMPYNWDYTLFQYNNITGVFDYRNQQFGIIPLSQEHIEEGEYLGTATENIDQSIHIVYTTDNTLYAPEATNIKIYNTNGQIISETQSNSYNFSQLPIGMYIIIAQYHNETITTKIINY